MGYPKANPVAKHDILCPTSIIDAVHRSAGGSINAISTSDVSIDTIDSLASSMVQSATPLPNLPPDIVKLATIYTYPDAPQSPKPLSRAPRVWRLVHRKLFDQCSSSATSNSNSCVQKCIIGVKLPSIIPQQDVKALKNSSLFHEFIHYLYKHNLVAMLARDSAGRIGFVSPVLEHNGHRKDDDESSYAAYLHYAPMKEFITLARVNYQENSMKLPSNDDELETWTPQYTPPREEECEPRGWENKEDVHVTTDTTMDDEPETWTPQYTPSPEEECGPRGWDDEEVTNSKQNGHVDENLAEGEVDDGTAGLFVPMQSSSTGESFGNQGDDGLWGWNTSEKDDSGGGWGGLANDNGGWDTTTWRTTTGNEMPPSDTGVGEWTTVKSNDMTEGTYHADSGAAAADAFYSNLTRSLDTRADSRLYHMRNFNGWVKATQITELDPNTSRVSSSNSKGKKRSWNSPLRVLDLACGKGGDLGKWMIHPRKVENYVGVDVARGSLIDAAIRARQMSKRGLRRCTFTLADLGVDVPGRKRSANAMRMQQLQTWNLQDETSVDQKSDPVFIGREGGGIDETDKFDVVSIQFAIHYMMSTRKRARRFFHTVSSLLEIGGNLIATTIDARVVVDKLMGLGLDYHFDDLDLHPEVDMSENAERHRNGNLQRKVSSDNGETVTVGQGVCRLKFDPDTLHKVFQPRNSSDDMFGLQYTFTLVEGSDHAAGVGEAVDLPEWLTPVSALEELAEESGLKLEYVSSDRPLSDFIVDHFLLMHLE